MENKGYLILNGGEAFTPETLDLDRTWLRIVRRGSRPRVLVIASAEPQKTQKVAHQTTQYFNGLGTFPSYKLFTTPLEANTLGEWDAVDKMEAIVLTDGSPAVLMDRLNGTHTHEALQRVLHRRACLVAVGASAMAMGAVYWMGGEWDPALNVAPHLAILPHHEHIQMRFPPERLLAGLPDGVTLIGVDERTAVMQRPDGHYEVMGAGQVTVYRSVDRLDRYRDGVTFTL